MSVNLKRNSSKRESKRVSSRYKECQQQAVVVSITSRGGVQGHYNLVNGVLKHSSPQIYLRPPMDAESRCFKRCHLAHLATDLENIN